MSAVSSFYQLTLAEFIKGISDAVVNDIAVLAYLQDANLIKYNCGGNGFEFRARVSKANIGGAVTDYSTGNAKTINPYITLVGSYRPYLWKLFHNALQDDRAKGAPAGSVISDHVKEDLNVIQQEAAEAIGQDLYGDGATVDATTGDDADATPVQGLEAIIDSSGTYFGAARATYTALQANEIACTNPSAWDDGLNNNFVKSLDEMCVACSKGDAAAHGSVSAKTASRKSEPDKIITTSTLFRILRQALMPQQIYTTEKTNNPIKELAFGTAGVAWDSFCTANRAYALNRKHLQLKVVGGQLIRTMMTLDSLNPLGKIDVIGAQLEQYSDSPRYLGKVTVTGS